MTELQNMERAREIGRVTADLRTRFVKHKRYLRLAEEFDLLLYRRRAEIESGLQSEARGLIVIGASGSGKTTAIRRLFAKHPDLHLPQPDVEQADVVSFLVPAPATLKSVGYDCLTSLGYPLNRDRTGAVIWSKVQTLLSRRKVLFLHLDEVQHLAAREIVETGACQQQQAALPPDAEIGMVLLHRFLPPTPRMRLEASDKKSRSTTSWPILACGFSTSFSEIAGSADVPPPNADAMFSIAVLFQPLIMVGWRP